MKSLFAALQFLTVIPVPASWGGGTRELERSVWYFPLVGLFLGVLLAVLDRSLASLLPPLPASAIIVLASIVLTGGFHVDGLADTADGFMSSRPKERILEIMKDSRTGPMGVAAVVSVVVLKVSLLSAVTGPLRFPSIVLMAVAGRSAMVMAMSLLPYARPEGLAGVFMQGRSVLRAGWGIAFLFGACWLMAGPAGMFAGLAALAATILAGAYSHNKIGGVTGDTLGATCEIVELAPLLSAAITIQRSIAP
ncbi:MAG TPA: adenosylcobinamide-GDP ribazoletransferase [Syntrophales bacterium]|nr:adenosylcobinamide-GDP ribazoletransferase [Syntrophales bacterium]